MLEEIEYTNAAGVVTDEFTYDWDANITSGGGLPLRSASDSRGNDFHYSYDEQGQLIGDGSQTWSYDASGNRIGAGVVLGAGTSCSRTKPGPTPTTLKAT